MGWERGHNSYIRQKELAEYCKNPRARARIFSGRRCGDGFLYSYGENFYVDLDWDPWNPQMLSSGDVIGLVEDKRCGFEPRVLLLKRALA